MKEKKKGKSEKKERKKERKKDKSQINVFIRPPPLCVYPALLLAFVTKFYDETSPKKQQKTPFFRTYNVWST